MKFVFVVLGVLFIPIAMFGQGYAWEWSPRQPRQMPTTYVGIEATAGYALHFADLQYSEGYLPCCSFTSGTGVPLSLMVFGEQWVKPWLALSVGLGMQHQSATLIADGDTLPRLDGQDQVQQVVTEWQLASSMTYLTLTAGGRMRLFESHALVGIQLRGLFNVSSGGTLSEHILSPDDFYFQTSSGLTKIRTVDSTDFAERASFYLEPAISMYYDVPLATGWVFTPLLQVSAPVTNLSASADWKYVALSVGIRITRGL